MKDANDVMSCWGCLRGLTMSSALTERLGGWLVICLVGTWGQGEEWGWSLFFGIIFNFAGTLIFL